MNQKFSDSIVGNFAVWDNLREHAFVFCWGCDRKVSMTQKLTTSFRLNDDMLLLVAGTTFFHIMLNNFPMKGLIMNNNLPLSLAKPNAWGDEITDRSDWKSSICVIPEAFVIEKHLIEAPIQCRGDIYLLTSNF